jgi:hypothetical protein
MTELDSIVELTASDLEAVAAGVDNRGNFIAADVIVQDVNVNVNALTPFAPNLNA